MTTDDPRRVRKLLDAARHGDVESASELATMAACYVGEGERLPDDLANFLASALKRAANAKPTAVGQTVQDARIVQLAHGLRMKRAANRPRLASPDSAIFVALVVYGMPNGQTDMAKAVADTSDLSVRTAHRRIADMRARVGQAERRIGRIIAVSSRSRP